MDLQGPDPQVGVEFKGDEPAVIGHDHVPPEPGVAHVVTDRLGTHPVYYVRPSPDTFAFSTRIQALSAHLAVPAEFDVEYLSEYLSYGSVGGVKTPLAGVEELPPSSVTTVDLDDGTVTTERYWRPEFDPLDRPFSYFRDEFVERFEAALADRIDPDSTYGLLLSGGSDARAILAGPVSTRMSTSARTTRPTG